MTLHEYTQEVTRTEVFTVSEATLTKERNFQRGRAARKAGLPCYSANGAFLDGWYNPETPHYFITAAAAHLL